MRLPNGQELRQDGILAGSTFTVALPGPLPPVPVVVPPDARPGPLPVPVPGVKVTLGAEALEVVEGTEILGFCGRHGNLVHALGVWFR